MRGMSTVQVRVGGGGSEGKVGERGWRNDRVE